MLAGARLVLLCLFSFLPATALAQSTVAELNESGWKMLDAGNGARAARLFAEALALQPDEPALLFGAAVSAQLLGKPAEAKPRLRRALEVNPRFTPASLLLGEIVYREGDLPLAIKTYERALTLSPGDPDLTVRLEAWRREADVHSGFVERRQDRFRVSFEGRTDAQAAARATEVLTNAFWRIGQALGAYPSDTIVVILYTQQQFRDITRAPEWSDGLYDGRIRIPVAGASREPALFESVLVHELTHAMIASLAPRGVPVWLHEGLAQHFEGADVRAARQRLKAHGRRLPLAEIEHSLTSLTPAGARVAYDQSLLAVTAILQRPGVNWIQLLHAMAGGQGAGDALRGVGLSYADLEVAFDF